jgi:phosphonoacetate hydrolase
MIGETVPATVNGRPYRRPRRPTVVFTIDGGDPRYLDVELERHRMPWLRAMLDGGGAYHLGQAQMPTLTNPNNLSIVTGAAPSVHGIPGNHYRAPDGNEVQLVDPSFLRAPTIHAALRAQGARVLAVTAKDKLRRLLAAGEVPATSAERAADAPLPALGIDDVPGLVGRPSPDVYDWDLSHYAMEIGLAAHRAAGGLDLLYVSLTDFVQHTNAPGAPLAARFFARFDELLGAYLEAGFVVGITADHGMNAKPRLYFLEEELERAGIGGVQVVLPITDPYVRHHGALGSFAWVYLADQADLERARSALLALDGVEEVLTRPEATLAYEHPADRIGDLSVAADASTALGTARAKHDLSVVGDGLRSHGGRHEQRVPIMVSHRLTPEFAARHAAGVRSRDLHHLLLNGLAG